MHTSECVIANLFNSNYTTRVARCAGVRGTKELISLVTYFSFGVFLFNAIKAWRFPTWVPVQQQGIWIYASLGCLAIVVLLANSIVLLMVYQWSRRLPIIAAIFALSGLACLVVLGISEIMMPLVWQTAFGFFVVICALLDQYSRHAVGTIEPGSDRRSELHIVLRIALQFIVALSAIFGVAMSIIFTGGATKITQGQNALTDADLQATAIQMAFAFFWCVAAIYGWVIVPTLRRLGMDDLDQACGDT